MTASDFTRQITTFGRRCRAWRIDTRFDGGQNSHGSNSAVICCQRSGGLYEVDVNINDKNTLSVTTDFVTTSTADLNGVQFTGLTVGPQSVEGGRFSDIPFGIDADGVVYAFNTDGELQPVFADGATTLQLDLDPLQGDPVGLTAHQIPTCSGMKLLSMCGNADQRRSPL